MCLNLVANMLISYPSFKCLYIDSNNNFCVHRLTQLINSKSFDGSQDENKLKKHLESVRIIECQNVFHLLKVLFQVTKPSSNLASQASSCSLTDSQTNETFNPNLIVIDNLTSLFSMFKSNNQLDIQYFLNYVSNQIKYLASSFNTAIVFTSNIDHETSFIYSSIFNESLKELPNVSIKLIKLNNSRVFELMKCNRPNLSESISNTDFEIDSIGLK